MRPRKAAMLGFSIQKLLFTVAVVVAVVGEVERFWLALLVDWLTLWLTPVPGLLLAFTFIPFSLISGSALRASSAPSKAQHNQKQKPSKAKQKQKHKASRQI